MRYLIAVAFSCLSAATVSAQLPPPVQSAVANYRAAIAGAAEQPPGRSLEPAFKAFEALWTVLMSKDVLASLTEEQFAGVRSLKGLVVRREDVEYVQPDVDFFGELARAHGDATDRAFFDALKATYPSSASPAYIEQQTDLGGCTRFGSLTVAGAYVRWVTFQTRFPGRYTDYAHDEAEHALELLTKSTCACGEASTVERELERALRDVPATGPRAALAARLEEVRAGRAGIEPRCVGGR